MPEFPENWSDTPSYDYIDDLSAPEIGWEWLRRNDFYRADYTRLVRSSSDSADLIKHIRDRWGLRFPCRASLQSP
ncbi:transcriptional regulator domain-containing protein [Labrys okinawensis]|uniref:transcriptional regulator domain-containing protein n=1 Tax=Labrys okinawensis TaxID=346911 RepID=UPI0039BD3DAE